jgi:branched-chain amino acid aminotransferase
MIVEPRPDQLTWLDGSYVPWRSATMHVTDHHYGVGVFEGVRSYACEAGAAIFRLREHTARLFRSAHILNIPVPDSYGPDLLSQVQIELVRKNELRDAYLRPFLFYGGAMGLGPRTRGLKVHVAVLALGWIDDGAYSGPAKQRGVALRSSSMTRHHANSVFSKAKANANYMNGILALQEAQASGADDVLLLDAQGYVTETSGANLFVVRDGVLYTPPLECVLEGVTRDTIIQLAAELGVEVRERRMTRDDIYVADEAFLTGTAVEVTTVRELDGRTIGRPTARPITERLKALYSDHVRGRAGRQREWLTTI